MRQETEWWGIMIVAETERDEQILRDLYDALPEEATRSDGVAVRAIYSGNNNETILEFRR